MFGYLLSVHLFRCPDSGFIFFFFYFFSFQEEYKIDTPTPRQYDDDREGGAWPPPALCPLPPVLLPPLLLPPEEDGDEEEGLDDNAEKDPGPSETPAVTRSSFTRPSQRMRTFQDWSTRILTTEESPSSCSSLSFPWLAGMSFGGGVMLLLMPILRLAHSSPSSSGTGGGRLLLRQNSQPATISLSQL